MPSGVDSNATTPAVERNSAAYSGTVITLLGGGHPLGQRIGELVARDAEAAWALVTDPLVAAAVRVALVDLGAIPRDRIAQPGRSAGGSG